MPSDPDLQRSRPIDGPVAPLGHEALLTLARKVRAAAADTDPERLQRSARRFSFALDRHLRAEAAPLSRAVPAAARRLIEGQERISDLAAALVEFAEGSGPVPRRDSTALAEELVAFLSLQARDEHHALDRSAA